MSTNYYMLTKNKKFADTYFPEEYELYRGGDVFKAEIHIGKSSAGWMPLFREHKHAYDSVEKLRAFLREYADDIEIIDEYHNFFTAEELDEELIYWKEQQEKYPDRKNWKYVPVGVPDEIFGGRRHLIPVEKDEKYDLKYPIDHVEYEKLDPYYEFKGRHDMYYHDKDGYNFTNRDFS